MVCSLYSCSLRHFNGVLLPLPLKNNDMTPEERENGFYWVELGGTWIIARWSEVIWFITGYSEGFYDEDFETINEVRIENNII